MTQFQATAQNDFLVSVPCHTTSFSDQADVALALHLIFLCSTGFMHSNAQLDGAWCHHQPLGQEQIEGHSSRQEEWHGHHSCSTQLPCFQHPCSQSCCGWERLLSPRFASKFASSGQSVSSERQNLCTTPELEREGRRNAKGGGAIWPSGDRAAKKLQTLACDDLLWPWSYVSYQQVSGSCGAPHIQRISASPHMAPLSSRATITKAGAQFAPKCFTQKQCMWKKKKS